MCIELDAFLVCAYGYEQMTCHVRDSAEEFFNRRPFRKMLLRSILNLGSSAQDDEDIRIVQTIWMTP